MLCLLCPSTHPPIFPFPQEGRAQLLSPVSMFVKALTLACERLGPTPHRLVSDQLASHLKILALLAPFDADATVRAYQTHVEDAASTCRQCAF